MRLKSPVDQGYVKRLLPDPLGEMIDKLTSFRQGYPPRRRVDYFAIHCPDRFMHTRTILKRYSLLGTLEE